MRSIAKRLAGRVLGPPTVEESAYVRRFLGNASPGVLLEVGAHYGDRVFLDFARDGWTIHAFEPDAANRAPLEAATAGMANVVVVPKAVADKPGRMTLYRSAESTGISSLAAFTTSHEPGEEVEVITLADYLAEEGIDRVDFLKMDVEGYEKFVMAGFPWETHRPRAIVMEFEDSKTLPLGYSWRDLADELQRRGYMVLVSEWYPVKRYGTRHQWRRFAWYPTELIDSKAWGNLIAVLDDHERLGRIVRRAVLQLKVRRRVDAIRGR